MKNLIIFVFCLLIISCGCGHKEGEHLPNDTILCVVDKKHEDIYYNVVLKIIETQYNVKFRNIETGNTKTIDRKLYYDMFKEGDTIYEIVHYCPYYKVELKDK